MAPCEFFYFVSLSASFLPSTPAENGRDEKGGR